VQLWSQLASGLKPSASLGIYLRGGRGYWPRNEICFEKITGLTEKDKIELMKEWEEKAGFDCHQV
jgi:hypothetical protein